MLSLQPPGTPLLWLKELSEGPAPFLGVLNPFLGLSFSLLSTCGPIDSLLLSLWRSPSMATRHRSRSRRHRSRSRRKSGSPSADKKDPHAGNRSRSRASPAGTRSLGTNLDPHRLEEHTDLHHIDPHHIQFAGAKIARFTANRATSLRSTTTLGNACPARNARRKASQISRGSTGSTAPRSTTRSNSSPR